MIARATLRRLSLPGLLLVLSLVVTACANQSGPGTTVTINNVSGSPIRNVEVNFTKVGFGVPSLNTNESHTHWTQPGTPCHIKVKFEDSSGRVSPEKKVDFGESCPRNIALDIGAQGNVSGKAIQK